MDSYSTSEHFRRWPAGLAKRYRGTKKKWLINGDFLRRHSRIGVSTELQLGSGSKFELGKISSIEGQCRILIRAGGAMVMGNSCWTGRGSEFIVVENASLCVGEHVVIGIFANIRSTSLISIGNDTRIGQFVSILAGQYNYNRKDKLIGEQGYRRSPTSIGNGVWVGAGAMILEGVTVGDGAIIGAGAVVTSSVGEYSVAAGNPARIIGQRE